MSTLRFPATTLSQGLISANPGAIATTGAGTAQSIITGNNSTGISILLIYKGTVESFPSFTDRSTRASDLLITFTLPASEGFSDMGVVNNSLRYLIGKHLPNQAASASGVASWFLLCRSGTTSLTDKGALLGTVGITGSGADLEIPDTSIISGNNYQCAGFYINVPQNWTV